MLGCSEKRAVGMIARVRARARVDCWMLVAGVAGVAAICSVNLNDGDGDGDGDG